MSTAEQLDPTPLSEEQPRAAAVRDIEVDHAALDASLLRTGLPEYP